MPRLFLTLMAAVWGLLLLPPSDAMAQSPKRVALVIGNGAYQNVARLPNPSRDATAIADMFRKAGFDKVIARQDVGNLEFKRALREFGDAASDADIAVVYYAGHGIQVRDMNYMIPVDAKLATEIDAEDEAVSLDRIVAALEPARAPAPRHPRRLPRQPVRAHDEAPGGDARDHRRPRQGRADAGRHADRLRGQGRIDRRGRRRRQQPVRRRAGQAPGGARPRHPPRVRPRPRRGDEAHRPTSRSRSSTARSAAK